MVQLFRYETHTHTAEVSRCSRISAVELVRVYKDLGFSGVCITDHFLNGIQQSLIICLGMKG